MLPDDFKRLLTQPSISTYAVSDCRFKGGSLFDISVQKDFLLRDPASGCASVSITVLLWHHLRTSILGFCTEMASVPNITNR